MNYTSLTFFKKYNLKIKENMRYYLIKEYAKECIITFPHNTYIQMKNIKALL